MNRPSYLVSLAMLLAVGLTTTAEATLPGCGLKFKPGCYHPPGNLGDRPGRPKGPGNGMPVSGINCTYTNHGPCSPD